MAVTIPDNAEQLEEALGDTSTLRAIKDEGEKGLFNFITGYAEKQARRDPDIARQVEEATERQWQNILRNDKTIANINRLNLDPRNGDDGWQRPKHYGRTAPGAKLDKEGKWNTWAAFFGSTWDGSRDPEALAGRAELKKIQNSFGSTVPSDGGFLIPERLRAELLRVPLEMGTVRSRARVVPMDSLTVPYPMIDTTTNATSVYGGVTGYWTQEGGSLTDSAPTFGRIDLIAKKLTLYSVIPNELFQDSIISLEQFMMDAYPEALLWFEDVGFTSGDGVGQPLGYLNGSAVVSVAKEAGQTAATIVWNNIVKMYSRMLPSSMSRAVWVCNIDVFPELATLSQAVGTGGTSIWIGDGGGEGAPPVRILGRPVVFTEKVSTLGTAGDINLVDFGYYLIGDRQMMQSATSVDFKFDTDETAVRLIERVDGQPWIKSAITPQSGSANTLSPFVSLATRA